MLPIFALFITAICGAPSLSYRPIQYDEKAVFPVYTQIGYITEIIAPKNFEAMMDEEHGPRVGYRKLFRVNAAGNVVYIEPQDDPDTGGGKSTTVSVNFTNGKHLSLIVYEVSKTKGAHADLKVIVEDKNNETESYPTAQKYILFERYQDLLHQLEEKTKLLALERQQQAQLLSTAENREALSIRGHYELTKHKGKNFHSFLYRDKIRTFVDFESDEAPTVWAIREGKESKVDAHIAGKGHYEIQGLIDEVKLTIGKSYQRFQYRLPAS